MSETRSKKRARGPSPSPVAVAPPDDLRQQLEASLQRKDLKGAHALLSSFPLFPAVNHPSPLLLLEQPGASRLYDPSYSDRALAGLTFERGLRLLAKEPCCELCGAALHAPSTDCRDLFGVFAHAKCFEEQLGNLQGLEEEEGSKVEAAGAPLITRKGVSDKYKWRFGGMSHGRKDWDKELVSSTPWERHYAWVTCHALVEAAVTVEGLAALPLPECAGVGEVLRAREETAASLIRQAIASLHLPSAAAAAAAAAAVGAAGAVGQ